MTQCAKIIAGCTANVGNVFIKRFQTFFFLHFFTFFTFFNFFWTFITSVPRTMLDVCCTVCLECICSAASSVVTLMTSVSARATRSRPSSASAVVRTSTLCTGHSSPSSRFTHSLSPRHCKNYTFFSFRDTVNCYNTCIQHKACMVSLQEMAYENLTFWGNWLSCAAIKHGWTIALKNLGF